MLKQMMKRALPWIIAAGLFCLLMGSYLRGQPGAVPTPQLPLYIGGGFWKYVILSPAFKVTGSVIDVPVTQGPAGAPGPAGKDGAQGPPGPAGPMPTFAPNDLYVLTQAQATFTLKCPMADIYWNEFKATASLGYTTNGKVATFAPYVPTAGDVVEIAYRCQ